MSPESAVVRLNEIVAHLWMVRRFLKHAEEIQENAEMLEVPRMIFDYVRALEPSSQAGDVARFLRLAKGKLPKLRRVAEYFQKEHLNVSDHTNYQMASASLTACVARIEEILAGVQSEAAASETSNSEAAAREGSVVDATSVPPSASESPAE